jgi:DNA processing protein
MIIMFISPACRQVLRLSSVKGLGLKRFYELLGVAGSVEALFSGQFSSECQNKLSPALWRAVAPVLSENPSAYDKTYLDTIETWLAGDSSRHVICIEDCRYPALLNEVFCPPPVLYVQGEMSVLTKPSISIVGSRKPSLAGLRHAQLFAGELAAKGICVTSGLALGIDGAAHRAAMQVGGVTCAVLGTGLDRIYPRQHESLAAEISCQGVLVSEMKLGTPPLPHHFPRRNRIVSGLSNGVLVVEAGVKSGSLISARFALEQNREVYAVPGSIDNLHAKGCHYLIKQGARLVESVDDVLGELRFDSEQTPFSGCLPSQANTSNVTLDDEERKLLELMGSECVSFDFLAGLLANDAEYLIQRLLILELKGLIAQVPGGYQSLKPVNFGQ